jgi:hypothetical protein
MQQSLTVDVAAYAHGQSAAKKRLARSNALAAMEKETPAGQLESRIPWPAGSLRREVTNAALLTRSGGLTTGSTAARAEPQTHLAGRRQNPEPPLGRPTQNREW